MRECVVAAVNEIKRKYKKKNMYASLDGQRHQTKTRQRRHSTAQTHQLYRFGNSFVLSEENDNACQRPKDVQNP